MFESMGAVGGWVGNERIQIALYIMLFVMDVNHWPQASHVLIL